MNKGAQTRTRILDHAMVLSSELGLEGLSIGVLADSLGLSKSGLYAHFRSKEALLLAVLERTREQFSEHITPRLESLAPGLCTLQAFVKGWLDWTAHPRLPAGCPLLGASFEFERLEGPVRERLVALQQLSRQRLVAMIVQAKAQHELLATTNAEQLVFELRGIVLSYHVENHLLRDKKARARADAAVTQLFLRYGAKLATDAV